MSQNLDKAAPIWDFVFWPGAISLFLGGLSLVGHLIRSWLAIGWLGAVAFGIPLWIWCFWRLDKLTEVDLPHKPSFFFLLIVVPVFSSYYVYAKLRTIEPPGTQSRPEKAKSTNEVVKLERRLGWRRNRRQNKKRELGVKPRVPYRG